MDVIVPRERTGIVKDQKRTSDLFVWF